MNQIVVVLLLCVLGVFATPLQKQGRIIGGEDARAGQFPFAAAITVQTKDLAHFCGGALISNQWIVTAAHCVQDAVLFRIQLGSNTLTGNDPNRQTYSTDTWFINPDFDPQTQNNDIGLIKLRLPIIFTDYIRAINLPTRGLDNEQSVVALGWGQISDQIPGNANILQTVGLTTISNDECSLTYGNQITNRMICAAGNFDEGTCIGDTGGPLIEQLGGLYLSGISSFLSGNGCETPDPSGYVRVYSFVPWIKNVTEIP